VAWSGFSLTFFFLRNLTGPLLVVEGVRSDVPFVVAVAVSRSRGRVTERVYRALVSSLLHSIDYSLARSLHPTLTPLASPLRLRTTSIVIRL
jgi:hypothetical protein